jgi:CheY-like chemotaxis protein
LLAEDNRVNQTVAMRILQKLGHSVVLAHDGKEALSLLAVEKFDLALMDLQMPEMDGLSATCSIRRQEEATGAHLPIIAMTAHAMKGDRERCLAGGMDEYVSKPVQIKELRDAISMAIKTRRASRPEVLVEVEEKTDHAPSLSCWNVSETLERLGGDENLLHDVLEISLPKHRRRLPFCSRPSRTPMLIQWKRRPIPLRANWDTWEY